MGPALPFFGKDGPGEINVPITIDGMVIERGDLIVCDSDGLLCVAFDDIAAVYASAKAKNDAEAAQMAAIVTGTNDRSRVDASLKKLICEFVPAGAGRHG